MAGFVQQAIKAMAGALCSKEKAEGFENIAGA